MQPESENPRSSGRGVVNAKPGSEISQDPARPAIDKDDVRNAARRLSDRANALTHDRGCGTRQFHQQGTRSANRLILRTAWVC
jgi:hypothetical protein